jgi:hypothetical protein
MSLSLPHRSASLRFAALFVVLVASQVAACSDGPTSPTLESIAGAYVLQTIDGAPLPVALYGSATDSIVDDGYAIDVDGTYSRIGDEQVFAAGRMDTLTVVDSGSVTLKGNVVSLATRMHGSVVLHGTIVGDVLTLSVTPDTFVYQRVRVAY